MPTTIILPTNPVVQVAGSGGTASNNQSTATGGGVPRINRNPVQVCGFVPLEDCNDSECREIVERQCCWTLNVFGDTSVETTTSTYENDITNFTVDIQLYLANPFMSAVVRLQKCTSTFPNQRIWTNVASMTGSTYGTNIAFGSYPQCPSYRGYIVNWGKVLNIHGAGLYRVQISCSFAGTEYCRNSPAFNLREFDCRFADQTVKFDAKLTGQIGSHNVQGAITSLCGFDFVDSIRLPGYFGRELIGEYLQVYNEFQNGVQQQVRNEAIQTFQFFSKLWPKEYHDRLKTYGMMADVLRVSDYNYANSDWNISQLKIKPNGNYAPEYYDKNRVRMSKVTVDFKAGVQNIIKSLCCKIK
ncbi:MAG: hypothetical protein FGM16_06870 [Flavobacterium sp.]|nr:hypothetical protein [Flavobacterium sp.]